MVEPDDFELSAVETLAHVASPVAPSWFGPLWSHWQQRVAGAPSRFNEFRGASPDPTDASATHWLESIGHVRIGCRLMEPPRGTPVRAGLLTLHAYRNPIPLSGEDESWQALTGRGVLVAAIRLRGYAGSRMDCAAYTEEADGWISRGLATSVNKPQDAMDWSLVQGVGDAACAIRALRSELDGRAGAGGGVGRGPALPLMIHGWSFGGGVAVIAAAQAGMTNGALARGACRVDRMVLGLPSLGDWSWRRAMGDRGARDGLGADVRRTLVAHAAREEEIAAMLATGDAALHARHVVAPTLCLLAARDEAVPAPAAAGVFNALSSDPGTRWRFLTPYGHFDGGIRNARRHAMFLRCRDEFLDPSRPAAEAMARWAPVLERGERFD